MFKNVETYLEQLRKELKDSDPALLQDALSDAEEHLRTALEYSKKNTVGISEAEALAPVIKKYGTPLETAAAYKEIEIRIAPALAPSEQIISQPFFKKFFGILADSRAWGAGFYMFLSLLTAVVFGGWGLLGGILSLGSIIFIIGLPVAGLFLLSVRGIVLIEGRFVEALLGVRMPRKPLFVSRGLSLTEKFKALVTESHTWKSLLYTILLFPLGFVYSILIFLCFAFSLSFITSPLLELVFKVPLELFGNDVFLPVWLLPIISIAGCFMLPLTLHFAKLVGKFHGKFAKSMLVGN